MSSVQLPRVVGSCQRGVDHRRLEELVVALAVVAGALVLGPPVTRLLGADEVDTTGLTAAAAASPSSRLAPAAPVVSTVAVVEVVPAAVVASHPVTPVNKGRFQQQQFSTLFYIH